MRVEVGKDAECWEKSLTRGGCSEAAPGWSAPCESGVRTAEKLVNGVESGAGVAATGGRKRREGEPAPDGLLEDEAGGAKEEKPPFSFCPQNKAKLADDADTVAWWWRKLAAEAVDDMEGWDW